jgi:hypothetical protein
MENYALIEHFKLVENKSVEGIKCDYFQGSQGNNLIPKTKINEYLKIKNREGFFVLYEENYYDELLPHSVQTYSQHTKYLSIELSTSYLEPEGLRKVIEITKEDPEIISELDL